MDPFGSRWFSWRFVRAFEEATEEFFWLVLVVGWALMVTGSVQ